MNNYAKQYVSVYCFLIYNILTPLSHLAFMKTFLDQVQIFMDRTEGIISNRKIEGFKELSRAI